MRREPFNDLHFRRALAALIPVDDIREIVLRGGGEPTSTVLAEQLPWHDTELEDLSRELEAATQEMEEAGYVIGSDGTLYYPPEGEDSRALQPLP
jgi:ABC-type transport system substrate-binding protein